MELLLDLPAGVEGVLMLGHVSEVNRKTFARGEYIDLKPAIAVRAQGLERHRAPIPHGGTSLGRMLRVAGIQKGVPYIHANEIAPFGQLHLGALVEISDAPVLIDDHHAVSRAFEHGRDAGCGPLSVI